MSESTHSLVQGRIVFSALLVATEGFCERPATLCPSTWWMATPMLRWRLHMRCTPWARMIPPARAGTARALDIASIRRNKNLRGVFFYMVRSTPPAFLVIADQPNEFRGGGGGGGEDRVIVVVFYVRYIL